VGSCLYRRRVPSMFGASKRRCKQAVSLPKERNCTRRQVNEGGPLLISLRGPVNLCIKPFHKRFASKRRGQRLPKANLLTADL